MVIFSTSFMLVCMLGACASSPEAAQHAQVGAHAGVPVLEKETASPSTPGNDGPVDSINVRVCLPVATGVPCSPLAPIYTRADLASTRAPAEIAAPGGSYRFYVKPGTYVVQVSGTGYVHDIQVAVPPRNSEAVSEAEITVESNSDGAIAVSLSGGMVPRESSAPAMTQPVSTSTTGQVPQPTPLVTTITKPNPAPPPAPGSPPLSSDTPASGPTSSIQYVAQGGSDQQDGLSWTTAKQTVFAACEALPGGAKSPPTCGHGTIYFTDGASANPTPGAGFWVMGINDPNYATPPAGWLHFGGSVDLVGVPEANYGPNSHLGRTHLVGGSSADRNHPTIWLSGNSGPIHLANVGVHYPARGIVLGECSNNTRTGKCGVQSVTFDNVTANLNRVAGNGPAWDITGGSFWLWFRDCGGGGLEDLNGLNDDKSAAFLFDGSGIGAASLGLFYMSNINTSMGGIKLRGAINSSLMGNITNYTREGDGVHAGMPAVWIASGQGTAVGPLELTNIAVADSAPNTPAVRNDIPAGGWLTVSGLFGAGQNMVGPAIVLDQYQGQIMYQPSPLLQGQTGFDNGRVIGQSDVARRLFTPSVVRFPNIANQGAAITCTNYGGGVTRTTGVAAPDGTSNAVQCTTSTDGYEYLNLYTGNRTLAVGDWFIAGWWSKSSGSSYDFNGLFQLATAGFACVPPGFSSAPPYIVINAYIYGHGEWHWKSAACKMTSIGTNPAYVRLFQILTKSYGEVVYAPVLMHIPTGAMSDGEAAEILNALASYPSAATAGDVAMMPGQRFGFSGSGNYLGYLWQSNTANRTYKFPDANGTVALTNITQTWSAPQTFDSPNLTDPTINGQIFDAFPIASFSLFLPGPLSTSYTVGSFTPEHDIVVTRVEVVLKTPSQGCFSSPVITFHGSNDLDVPLPLGTSDTGAINVVMVANTPVQVILSTPAQGCSVAPQDGNIIVHYRMKYLNEK